MRLFQKNRRDDFKLLKDCYMILLDDFYTTFRFDPGVIAEHRPDEVDATEYYLFLSGLTLASYAVFAKKTDPEAIKSFAIWTIGGIIREVYKSKSQESNDTLIGKHFERLAGLLETRQNECINLIVRDASKPRGERYLEDLTIKAAELIYKGRLSGTIQSSSSLMELSSFLMKHISNFSKLF